MSHTRHTDTMNDDETALQLALAIAVAGSWSAGAGLDFDSVPAPQVQPEKRAFAIWGFLFPSLGALVSYVGTQDVLPDSSVHALIGALAGTIAWAALVRRRKYGAAAVLLVPLDLVRSGIRVHVYGVERTILVDRSNRCRILSLQTTLDGQHGISESAQGHVWIFRSLVFRLNFFRF